MSNQSPEEIIYYLYPKRIAKKVALKSIAKALEEKPFEELKEATAAYAAAVNNWSTEDKQYVPMPATWFNQGRYDDDRSFWEKKKKSAPTHFSKTKSRFLINKEVL